MEGYISTIKEFNKKSTDDIVFILKGIYPNADNSQVKSWITLIDDVKNSSQLININDNCLIGFEISLPTEGMGIDLFFAGTDLHGIKNCFIIESKQWDDYFINSNKFSQYREDGLILHPQIQVNRHTISFHDYLDIGTSYSVNNFVFIRNCSNLGIDKLRNNNPLPSTQYVPVTNNMDQILDTIAQKIITGNILSDEIINAKYQPSKSIIDAMSCIISQNEPFILTQEQQQVIRSIKNEINNGKKIIRITGAAGSGKTAILLNLYVELLNRQKNGELIRPIFVSGAQNTAFYRSEYPSVEQSFSYSYSLNRMIEYRKENLYYVLMDEAQHNQKGIIQQLIDRHVTIILCYDISQVINADNAVQELLNIENRNDFICINLENSVRFNGSQIAEQNIKRLLNGSTNFETDNAFDLKLFTNLESFQNKIISTIKAHPDNTVAVAGLLSNDATNYTNTANSKSILFTNWGYKSECKWMPYVENKNYLAKNNGNLWVGTWWMPGLDVDYIAVIVGGDVEYSSKGIKANIKQTKLYSMVESVASQLGLPEYLVVKKYSSYGKQYTDNVKTVDNIINYLCDKPTLYEKFINRLSELIKNNYYIMMTRGRKGCYVFFTNTKEEK